MKRVVITGYGIVSCLGNDRQTVTESLREGKSGIRFQEAYRDVGMRSQVAGSVDIDLDSHIDRKVKRFMGDASAFAYIAMQQAIEDAGLSENLVSNPRTGLIVGSGGGSPSNQIIATDTLREKGIRRVGPYMVPRTMSSTVSACLATPFKIKGLNYSISSACATSSHCIGNGVEQIQMGKQDIVFAGGGEEEHWTLSMLFDGMGALSTKYNDTPEKASRTYDADRDGFVIAKSPATAPPPTAMTWWLLPAKARFAACSRPWRPSTNPSITSIPMAPVPRWATRRKFAPSARPSGTGYRRSVPVNPWRAIPWAPPVCRKPSIAC